MHETIPQTAQPPEAVRQVACSMCGAPAGQPCQRRPRADHVQRWLDACRAGLVTKTAVGEAVSSVTILTRWQVIPERAA
ncbi:MAG: hypothetical protein ACLP7J_30910 [Streptosporangiaceae bacterium]